ncbi:MAG TPA: hypothetical protein VGQ65_20675 [Thermoanaerobaculia bacterium]|jgi:hypothetical protein|nr:hypothetical protein [Thermoanaerobaculia bacterium]
MAIFHFKPTGIEPLRATPFQSLKLLERSDLQRLLRDRLEVIAPDAMLLAEEFGDWDDARRRIDLLAIDRDAKLVVIELKRTEDAGHIELQALRYAAMVSTMTFEQAADAHAAYLRRSGRDEDARLAILEFLGWEESTQGEFASDVRIVLVAADFQKEITTAVLWLNERELDIRCVRMQPYTFNGEVLVDVQQVIPLPEAAEYQVRVRERQEQRRASSALAGERDLAKFDVTVQGQVHRALNKRRTILTVARALVAAGISPNDISKAAPSRGVPFFASAIGDLDAQAFTAALKADRAAEGRPFDSRRWFCGEDELIHFGGSTFAVSNQWGLRTKETLAEIVGQFPSAGVAVADSEV